MLSLKQVSYIKFLLRGKTPEEAIKRFRITIRTFQRWKNQKDFLDACKEKNINLEDLKIPRKKRSDAKDVEETVKKDKTPLPDNSNNQNEKINLSESVEEIETDIFGKAKKLIAIALRDGDTAVALQVLKIYRPSLRKEMVSEIEKDSETKTPGSDIATRLAKANNVQNCILSESVSCDEQ